MEFYFQIFQILSTFFSGCRNKKINDDVCGKCKGTLYTKKLLLLYRGHFGYTRPFGNVSTYCILTRHKKKTHRLTAFKNSSDLTAFVSIKLPLDGQGIFCNGSLRVLSGKRKIPEINLKKYRNERFLCYIS